MSHCIFHDEDSPFFTSSDNKKLTTTIASKKSTTQIITPSQSKNRKKKSNKPIDSQLPFSEKDIETWLQENNRDKLKESFEKHCNGTAERKHAKTLAAALKNKVKEWKMFTE